MMETLKQLVEQTLTEKQRTVIQADLGGMPIEAIVGRLGILGEDTRATQ